MNNNVLTIAQMFSAHNIISAQTFGNGNINDTYLIRDDMGVFILQRLNASVFKNPLLIFENQLSLQQLLAVQTTKNDFRIPHLILTKQGKTHHKALDNHFWRAQEFIDHSQEIERVQPHQAQSIGRLLGRFHKLGMEAEANFHDTLPGLHATSSHLHQYQQLTSSPPDAPASPMAFCQKCIKQHGQHAALLDEKIQRLPLRLTHGDPKRANILFDTTSAMACSLIDLDTIGPGHIQHDLADLIRSCCNLSEEDSNLATSHFECDLAGKIIQGYSLETSSFLSLNEITLLGQSLWLMPFELGVRFLNDYLQGSTYFKISSPHHNLERAQNQFHLALQILNAQPALEEHLHSCFS